MTVWMAVEANQLNYYNNLAEAPITKELMKRTGVNLKFIHPPTANAKEQFNVMVAARDLPDVVMGYFDSYKGGASQAVKDGLIIDPKDYIKDYAPNLTKILNADPNIGKLMRNDEGQFIGFGARVNNDVKIGQGMAYAGPMIRKDLLDKAGLTVPETIDEWYNVLKTLKAKFPDLEAPLGWSDMSDASYFLASAYDIPNTGWYLNGDKIAYANIQPNFKKYLETVNKWYKEGLIQKDFATNEYTAKVIPMVKTGKVAAAPMHLYWYGVIQPELPKDYEFVIAPQPTLTKGQKLHIRADSGWGVLMANTKYITTKNKYPKETIQFFDYLYSDEGKLLTNWGIEGESYKMVNGLPEFTEAYTKDIAKMGYLYTPNVLKERIDDRMNRMQYKLPIQQQGFDAWSKQSDTALALPPGLTFTSEEQAENTKIMTDVGTYTKEMGLKFMMGVESLDKFDEYVKKVQAFGIDKVAANYNAAYERLKKR
ncbi:MAG: extracellular solute-binding protein [Paenibacillaceae bacterium]|nr:extracellular solute-binding protein [Paenibacillaceae bacterium]